ncbi:hypothetical protein OY671_009944, partial [Metschnikowia pulcherrima]
PYRADETERKVDAMIATATPASFAAFDGAGAEAADPIFVVGMPRSGSTSVEQILASHSQVEGTSESPDIASSARDVADYPEGLSASPAAQSREMGEQYIERTRVQRHTARPIFIDKMPNNWVHVPSIRSILPRARIIDARRHPLGCCFSNFKQHFARGQGFSYDLADMGRYYRDYVRLMAHIDRVSPG